MKKKVIRLNENDLRMLIKRSVGRILKEESFRDLDFDDEDYNDDFEDYDEFDDVEEIYDEDGLNLNSPETEDDLGLTPYDYDDDEEDDEDDDYYTKKFSRVPERYPKVRKMR